MYTQFDGIAQQNCRRLYQAAKIRLHVTGVVITGKSTQLYVKNVDWVKYEKDRLLANLPDEIVGDRVSRLDKATFPMFKLKTQTRISLAVTVVH